MGSRLPHQAAGRFGEATGRDLLVNGNVGVQHFSAYACHGDCVQRISAREHPLPPHPCVSLALVLACQCSPDFRLPTMRVASQELAARLLQTSSELKARRSKGNGLGATMIIGFTMEWRND